MRHLEETKTKKLLKELIREIEKAQQEDRSVRLDIEFNTGIVTHISNDIDMKEMEVFIKDIDEKRVLILQAKSATNRLPRVYIDITNSSTFYMDHSGKGSPLSTISTDLGLCKLYKLYTREKNIEGYYSCVSSITIDETEN